MSGVKIRKADCSSLLWNSGYRVRESIQLSKRPCVAFVCLWMACLTPKVWCSPQKSGPTCDAQSVFRLADAELKRQRYDQAERNLDRLLDCKTLRPIDTFNMGWLYGRAHNFRKALSEFNSVSGDVPDTKTHQYAIALAQFELADYGAAVETLKNKGESLDLS